MRVLAVISPPILLFHSFHVNLRGSSRWNYRLLRGILDFARGRIGLYIKSIFHENFRVALANGHFITVILPGACALGMALWTLCSAEIGSWSTARLFPRSEITYRYRQFGEEICAYISRGNLIWNAVCVLRGFAFRLNIGRVHLLAQILYLLHARLGTSGVWHGGSTSNWNIKWKSLLMKAAFDS